jgi:uncharacterized protein YdhG (YjbR/CyaY superfamily)
METTKLSTVEEYMSSQSAQVRATLEELRQIIKKAAPEAEELLSYQMPAFRFHGKLVWYAVTKHHYGLYILPKVLQIFKEKLAAYKQTKSAIHFPLDEPIPEDLVTEIIRYAVKQNLDAVLVKPKKP